MVTLSFYKNYMKSSKIKKQCLNEALRAVYLAREEGDNALSVGQRQDLMRDIRQLQPLNAPFNPFIVFNQVVWRFAEVASVMALILSIYVGLTGWSPIEEATAQYLANPVEFTVAQALGAYESDE